MSNKLYNEDNNVNLYDWAGRDGELKTKDDEAMREVFLNMDKALKYIHSHNYCVKSFSPLDIELLNGSSNHIRFKYLLELPEDRMLQRRYIKEDIFNSACVQVGLYTNSLKYLQKDFLINNFDEFAKYIPDGDVPYYRGVIQKGASVYFCEFALERSNRDLIALQKELGEEGIGEAKQLIKSDDSVMTNSKINDNIYKQINGKREAAFINYLVFPTLILLLVVAFSLIAWLFSLI